MKARNPRNAKRPAGQDKASVVRKKSGPQTPDKSPSQEQAPHFWDKQGFSNSPNRAISTSALPTPAIQRKGIDEIPGESATQVRVATERRHVHVSLKTMFSKKNIAAPTPEIEKLVKGNLQFTGVNEDMKAGLTNYVKFLLHENPDRNMRGFKANMSITQLLSFSEDGPTKLGRYSKSSQAKLTQDMVYRFTRYGTGKDQKIKVEELGPFDKQRQENAGLDLVKAKEKFEQYFSLAPGFGPGEDAFIYRAVAFLPDEVLSPIAGITFYRGTFDAAKPKTIARYSHGTKVRKITIFEPAFFEIDTLQGEFETGFRDSFEHAVTHELGHAVDKSRVAAAEKVFFEHVDEVNRLRKELYALKKKYREQRIWDLEAVIWQKEMNLKGAEIRREMASKRLVETATLIGDRYTRKGNKFDMIDAQEPTKFRFAEQLDGGIPITIYGKVGERGESFAEAFAAYYTDPVRFKALRPYLFQYFEGKMHLE